jgi:hypothetical protein
VYNKVEICHDVQQTLSALISPPFVQHHLNIYFNNTFLAGVESLLIAGICSRMNLHLSLLLGSGGRWMKYGLASASSQLTFPLHKATSQETNDYGKISLKFPSTESRIVGHLFRTSKGRNSCCSSIPSFGNIYLHSPSPLPPSLDNRKRIWLAAATNLPGAGPSATSTEVCQDQGISLTTCRTFVVS